MEISFLMTRQPVILPEDATALDAVEEMKITGCGMLPVGDKQNIKGVITDRDIMLRASAKNKDLSQVPVTDIMSRDVIFCDEDDILQRALYLMNKRNVRRILVLDKDKNLSGVLSMGDILRRIPDPLDLTDLLDNLESALREEELV